MSAITDIVENVKNQTHTARENVEEALNKARADTHHSILALIDERALKRADVVDTAISNGESVGRLAGVPFLAKDNILVFGAPTTTASRILENFDAPYQATVIEKLESEGAICIGKTNLDSFAHGGSTENSYFGPTTHPTSAAHVPGGSSGGSAAAVALGIVPFALGTDTGGSIRQPASFCGVVGLKPTYGTVSRYGVVAMASSTDVVGPITRSSEDAALVLECMAGKDSRDGTTLDSYLHSEEPSLKPLKIGLIDESLAEGVDPEVKKTVLDAVEKLRSEGHTVENISLPTLTYALAVYYIVVPAEISSNLARYDGIKFGHSSPEASNLSETYQKSRSEGFMDENKRRILIGNYVLSSGYYDAYYHKAQSVRTLIINEFNDAFETHDVLIGPTAPTPAFKLGQNTQEPLSMYLADILTVPASLAGIPALSIPFGTSSEGLPIGIQLTAKQRDDMILLQLGKTLEALNG